LYPKFFTDFYTNPQNLSCAFLKLAHALLFASLFLSFSVLAHTSFNNPNRISVVAKEKKTLHSATIADCPRGDFFLRSQGQVDSFALKYNTCDSVVGRLYLIDSTITDISKLTFIKYITGDLSINGCRIKNIDGLSQLKEIGGNLGVFSNKELENINGFSNLIKVKGFGISVNNNLKLASLRGLQNIVGFSNAFSIQDNRLLIDLQGLPNLSTLNSLTINQNNGLKSLSGLEGLTTVQQTLTLQFNKVLNDLIALKTLKKIHFLNIGSNDTLSTLAGLEGIDSIGYLYIQYNRNLAICDLVCGWINKKIIKSPVTLLDNAIGCNAELKISCSSDNTCPKDKVELYSQAEVDAFAIKYAACDSIFGDVILAGNTITDISGLSFIRYIKGQLSILNCNRLKNIDGFSKLKEIGGSLTINNNDSLTNINGLSSLTSLLAAGSSYYYAITITNNKSLVALSGLQNITKMGNHMAIQNNAKLIDLKGLPVLKGNSSFILSVGANDSLKTLNGLDSLKDLYSLSIYNNSSLVNLTGLNGLRTINREANISLNKKLVSLSGLEKIERIGSLNIVGNTNLSSCDLICQWLNTRKITSPNNNTISNNASGCSSSTELSILCSTSTCPTGDFILNTQAEVSAFATKYAACDSILGSFSLSDTNITDISALKFIKYIRGSFWVYNTTKIKNLDGFSQLREIGGDVDINFNTGLESIIGLKNVKKISGSRVRIYSNQ
jgi:hypothetical protein